MNLKIFFTDLVLIILVFILMSCSKDTIEPIVQVPVLTTDSVYNITTTIANAGGNITEDGGYAVTIRGVCWSTASTPTINDSSTKDGAGAGVFTSILKGLIKNTTYYVRAYATNNSGTGYGTIKSFTTTSAIVPSLSTTPVNNVSFTSATSGGTITSDGGATIIARGVCWGTGNTPTVSDNKTTDGTGSGIFTSNLIGLIPNITYYVRAYATNSEGTGYGSALSFTTLKSVPTLTTSLVTNIRSTSITCGGNITSEGGGAITARGVCWSTSSNPTIADSKTMDGTGTGSFTSNITGLIPNTTYFIQAYATNSFGTSYGGVVQFKTDKETVSDIDGNEYHFVKIGSQVWMVENLKTTRYRNGDSITNVTDNTAWGTRTTGAYCNYNNNLDNGNVYGRLYNWYAVNDSRKIAPIGWHVASDSEWTTLTNFLGGDNLAGGKLKDASDNYWSSPNTGATNETGFTALPGGFRNGSSTFTGFGSNGMWWSSTEYSASNAWGRTMRCDERVVNIYNYRKISGMSIRCLKDE